MRDLRQAAEQFKNKLLGIKLCAFDCDGVLTDGSVFWQGEETGWNRCTSTRDGYGIKILQDAGIKVGVITGGNSLSVEKRFKESLKVDFLYAGNEDKREAYLDLLNQGFKDNEILYMGDELFDIPLLKRCGFSATPPTTSHEVRESVDYITEAMPGHGCVREVIDMLRYAQGITTNIADFQS